MDKTKTTIHTMGTVILIYAILVFAGGLMGFIMKKSLPSLMGGGLFGLSLVFTSIQTFALRKWGLYASLMLILILDAFFSYRFLTTHTFFPSGVMLLISTGTLLILVLKLKKLDALPKKTVS